MELYYSVRSSFLVLCLPTKMKTLSMLAKNSFIHDCSDDIFPASKN